MSTYIKKFINHNKYNEYINGNSLILPNVSLCLNEDDVHYNPYIEPETRLICKYNVTDTVYPTTLRTNYEQNIFKSMEIDNVMLDELVTEYKFDTVGEHTVKYELYDEIKLGNTAPVFQNNNLIECIIPDNVTNISQNTFYECNLLTSINIPNSVTNIGGSVFYNCSSLTSIDIPDSVTRIYAGTFYGCIGITNIDIPSGVTEIENSAFMYCVNLTSIVSNAITAPLIQNSTFQGIHTNGILTVPSGSTGYDTWMGTGDFYLGKYGWTKVEQ